MCDEEAIFSIFALTDRKRNGRIIVSFDTKISDLWKRFRFVLSNISFNYMY